MNTTEFSNTFDEIYNQQYYLTYNTVPPFALNEYDKSVFLTKAQENLVDAYYTGKFGVGGFEDTEEMRRALDVLVTNYKTSTTVESTAADRLTVNSVFYELPDDIYQIVYEQVVFGGDDSCTNGRTVAVVPCTHDEYYKTSRDPFKRPGKNRALRIDVSGKMFDKKHVVELVSEIPISSYQLRYIRRPKPIILVDLADGFNDLTINNVAEVTESELNPSTHRIILDEAVRLAVASRVPSQQNDKNNSEGDNK